MKIIWLDLDWKIPWIEIGWWFVFSFIILLGFWYLYWFTSMPFWSFEPVLKKNDLFRGLFGSTTWKKIG